MLNNIMVPETAPAVKPQLTDRDRAALRTAGVRVYTHHARHSLGLEKRCPHCAAECFAIADTDDELAAAITWYTDPDFACHDCRAREERESLQRARATGPNLLTAPAPVRATPRGCPASAPGTHSRSRRRNTPPRPRFSKRAAAIRDAFLAYDLACAFLTAIERGEVTATDHALATATTQRDAAARRLRQLGAM